MKVKFTKKKSFQSIVLLRVGLFSSSIVSLFYVQNDFFISSLRLRVKNCNGIGFCCSAGFIVFIGPFGGFSMSDLLVAGRFLGDEGPRRARENHEKLGFSVEVKQREARGTRKWDAFDVATHSARPQIVIIFTSSSEAVAKTEDPEKRSRSRSIVLLLLPESIALKAKNNVNKKRKAKEKSCT
jgi:hypothetical protein